MCGRYSLTPAIDELLRTLGLADFAEDLEPRYNVAPSQQVPALRLDDEGTLQVGLFKWGLIPSWAKDPAIGNRMINARSETITEKPSFRAAFSKRRCVILTDGWYEWMKTPDVKQPVRIQLEDGSPFGFAGLWEQWVPKGTRNTVRSGWQGAGTGRGGRNDASTTGAAIQSCTIITAAAAPAIEKIHHRMPCLLKQPEWDAWLAPDAPKEMLLSMLGPYQGDDLKAYAVSTAVNSPKNDREDVIEPADVQLDLGTG